MSEADKKLEKDTDKAKEAELIPVGPGVDAEAGERVALEADEPDEKDDAEETEDTRLSGDEEEDKPRRKESAKERRLRDKQKRHRDRLELNYYRQRNEELEKERVQHFHQLEGRVNQLSTAAVDQRIAKIEEQLVLADNVSFEALKAGTRDDYQQAQSIRDKLNAELVRLQHGKQTASQRQASAQQQKQPEANPEVAFHARQWTKSNQWFDPNLGDEESVIVRAIDDAVASEGFDPTTKEYWSELTRRVKRRLPEKFSTNGAGHDDVEDDAEDEEEERPQKRQAAGPKFSSGGRERPLRKGEVYISAERKRAMMDAGLWEDPGARQRMLKRYAQMDAELSASRTN